MPTGHLIAQQIQEVHFVNQLKRDTSKLELVNSFSFHIDYLENNTKCVARLYQCAKDKEDDQRFFVSVQMSGVFQLEGVQTDEDKREMHVQCYNMLFPYIQVFVSQLAAASGLRGFLLKRSTLNKEQISVQRKPQEPTLPIV